MMITQLKNEQGVHTTVINNIQMLLHKNNMSEAELSRRTGIPQPTLHKIFSGKTNDPRISTLKTIADYFSVSLDSLYSNNVLHTMTASAPLAQLIPVISWEDCIKLPNSIQNISPANWEKWIAIDNNQNTKFTFGLISRPSMEPRFPRGTTLIINAETQPIDGDLVVVQYPNTNEATLRELLIDGPNKLLVSLNQSTPPHELGDIKIIGTLIQSRFSYQN